MNLGEALELCMTGKKIAREGWNGADQFVFYSNPFTIEARDVANPVLYEWAMSKRLETVTYWGSFDFKPTNNKVQRGWLASQADLQADDWYVVR